MLSTNSVTTPRPLPPAKTRKSSAMHYSRIAPPPPYAPLSDMLLDSPIPFTAQLMNAASMSPEDVGPEGLAPMDEWMDEKSREELSDLLVKADGLIKARETELSYTSALCKGLYDDNVALKTKHEALLARLPGTGVMSPTPSTPASPRLYSPNAAQSPPYPGIMFPTSSDESLQPLPPAARLRHTRRISVTPAELAHLSDQNAELLDKLEQLESESTKADQAGKRKLRKLEQEIQTLRDELEKTQARGAELEEQAKAAARAVKAQRRKEEREARAQALNEKSVSDSDSSGAEIKDFAPPPVLSRPTPRKHSQMPFEESEIQDELSDASDEPMTSDAHVVGGSTVSRDSYFSARSAPIQEAPRSGTEYAIVSQLLAKICELEQTNAQIKEQQRITEERMRAAQWDVDSIRRVYDCLDVADIDIEEPEAIEQSNRPSGSSRIPSGGTIRFSSLRRTLVGDSSRLGAGEDQDGFAGGISKDMQSTVREEHGVPRGTSGHKARKSVVGLFDPEPEAIAGDYPPSLRVSPSFRPVVQPQDQSFTSTWSVAATDGLPPPSPSFSTLQTPLEGPSTGRTLGSELGSEYGDDWPERGFNHHLRASSLYELSGLDTSQSAPGSPTESHAVPPSIVFPAADEPGPSTPPRPPALQLNIEPPTPSPEKLHSPAATRQHRLSQTVRARTNRWVEGRFQQDSLRDNVLRKRQSSATLGRRSSTKSKARAAESDVGSFLDETFDDAVLQVKRVRSRASLATLAFPSSSTLPERRTQPDRTRDDEQHEDPDRSVELRRLSQSNGAAVMQPARREGIVGFVLEAWLWLQFIVVVLLFLWAMAKRGPQVVLEAERRGARREGGH